MDQILHQLVDALKVFGNEFVVTVVAMIPIFELRGAVPVGLALGMPWYKTFIFALIGNIIPMPFILLFIQKIFVVLRRFKFFDKLITRIENKAKKNIDKVKKYEFWGLCIFVAIPLPGTGGWTGALIGSILEMRFRDALASVVLGILIADIVVTGTFYGLFNFMKFLF